MVHDLFTEENGMAICKDCDKMFKRREGLEIHIRDVHGDPCKDCGKIFKGKERLKTHIQYIHRTFNTKEGLEVYI